MSRQPVILVVDDSAFNRRTLTKILEDAMPECRVVTARDGEEALQKVDSEDPAVITLDLEMPRMDGFTFLRVLMNQKPRPVIVVSAKNDERSLLKALELGALDYLAKPMQQATMRLHEISEEYVQKIRMALSMERHALERRSQIMLRRVQATAGAVPKVAPSGWEVSRIVLIGASTGGPAALQTLLTQITPRKNMAIVVAQHMPENFTGVFAARLNTLLPFEVKEGTSVEMLAANTVYIARGGRNIAVTNQNDKVFLASLRPPPTTRFVPSVDHLFETAALNFPRRMLGVILTGMGSDGVAGARALRSRNVPVLVESEKTAVVFGMPKAAIDAGVATGVFSLDTLAGEINDWLGAI